MGIISYWTFDISVNGKFEPLYIFINYFDRIFYCFWNDVILSIPDDRIIILQLVAHSEEKENWNVSPFIRTNKNEIVIITQYFIGRLEIYLNYKIIAITFKYYIFEKCIDVPDF